MLYEYMIPMFFLVPLILFGGSLMLRKYLLLLLLLQIFLLFRGDPLLECECAQVMAIGGWRLARAWG